MDRRGQLNVDVGIARKREFKRYCKRSRVSMLDCLKQLIDYVTKKEKKETHERTERTGRKSIED